MSPLDAFALAAAAALLLTMPLYALVSRGRPRDPEVAARPTTVLLGHWVRDWLMWVIAPLERALVRARVSPLVFNLAGVGLGAAAGVAYAQGAPAAGGWLVLLGGAADVFDGRIARARGMISPAGAFLDSTLDRFAEAFAFAGMAMFYAGSPLRILAVALALGGSLLVSYTRARGEGLGVSFRGGLMQRAERLVLLALASLLDPVAVTALHWAAGSLLVLAVAFIALASTATAAFRTVAIARALDQAERRARPGPGAPRRRLRRGRGAS